MDRRDFFKSIFLTSLLTPLLLASKDSTCDAELYLISDSPNHTLPVLLQELKTLGVFSGHSYSLQTLTASRLDNPACPSFALVREGKIWDLRTRRLLSLWTEMNQQAPSAKLTVASFHARPAELMKGKAVSLYKDGHKVKTLSLRRNSTHFFQTKNGRITVRMKDGKVWVEDSSCTHKICVHCPPAAYAGERIICAPNHFMLMVDGPTSIDTIIG